MYETTIREPLYAPQRAAARARDPALLETVHSSRMHEYMRLRVFPLSATRAARVEIAFELVAAGQLPLVWHSDEVAWLVVDDWSEVDKAPHVLRNEPLLPSCFGRPWFY